MGSLFLKSAKLDQAMGLAGILVSVALANIRLNLPYIVGWTLYFALALFMALAMPETGFRPQVHSNRPAWQSLTGAFAEGVRTVRGHPVC